ncbi:MAG: hypothetical protein LH473_13650 [Chitinophagales bacterium]|nr:hypothetical protein [Chitinophagales bacterium]
MIDQIIYDDNGIYFVGKTESPKSGIAQFANCATTTYLGGTGGDAYIAYRNTMCGDTWTTFFGCSTAKEYAYCIAEDKVSTKKFFYAAGEIDYGSNPSPMTAAACVGTCNTIKQDVVNANDIGKDDGFIAKYDGTGHMIRWTYFGGDGQQALTLQ